MHRSSESVAALASALAKAQAELVNPEKSLTAVVRSGRAGEGERRFRYAPLASGLDIVRKTLGQHEIAVIQTTEIDKETGTLKLTTVLAHASGEWIASDWPVCPVAETANPQRMGAALTYARRYALFTLVGIAGEDDLDAPDLCSPAVENGEKSRSEIAGAKLPPRSDRNGRPPKLLRRSQATLSSIASGALRDRLLSEISALHSRDSAINWARQALRAKNQLSAEDAKLIEDAFAKKESVFSEAEAMKMLSHNSSDSLEPAQSPDTASGEPYQSKGVRKTSVALTKRPRQRNKDHLRFVRQQPCLLCGRKPSDAHHVRFVQPRALGKKVSDEFAVPLCRSHHRAVHRIGDERAWWQNAGIDPLPTARKLWNETHTEDPEAQTGRTAQAAVSAPLAKSESPTPMSEASV
jgi:ERF superfamily protein